MALTPGSGDVVSRHFLRRRARAKATRLAAQATARCIATGVDCDLSHRVRKAGRGPYRWYVVTSRDSR